MSSLEQALDARSDASYEAYEPNAIEPKWQAKWQEGGVFATREQSDCRSAFVLVAPPFTSGEAHMGHVRSYSIGDANARFRRAQGEDVLFSLGFDAFGLPAEKSALERDLDPHEWVEQCARQMREQLERLGFSFDWERSYLTSTPDMYQWSQWLFLVLHEAGLVVERETFVDWCDGCETALSRSQALDGRCWRCDGRVSLAKQRHWHLRLSVYNEENDRRLEQFSDDWNDAAIEAQRTLLGRSDGVEFEVSILGGEQLLVFTPHPDHVSDTSFIAVSPLHPSLQAWMAAGIEVEDTAGLAAMSDGRRDEEIEILDTGLTAQIPGVEGLVPIVVSPIVDSRYGPTAVLGIPSVDSGDAEIAQRLPPPVAGRWRVAKRPLEKRPAVRYRAADFPISRQRAWGAPVPMIRCPDCGPVPVPVSDLPVRLPSGLRISGSGNALAESAEFRNCTCPACNADAERETTTLDCHVDAFWIIYAVAVPAADRQSSFFDHPELRRWLPITQFVQGADTGGFVLDERTVIKALRDSDVIDFLPDGEPISRTLMHEMVHLNGRKMSKHLKNVVNPTQLMDTFGADTLRFAMLYAAAPTKSFTWDPNTLHYSRRFLDRLWQFTVPRLGDGNFDSEFGIEGSTAMRRRLARWCDTALERTTQNFENLEMHRATRNTIALFNRIQDFEQGVLSRGAELTTRDREAVLSALALLIRLLGPLAPHLAEELWSRMGNRRPLAASAWPSASGARPGQTSHG